MLAVLLAEVKTESAWLCCFWWLSGKGSHNLMVERFKSFLCSSLLRNQLELNFMKTVLGEKVQTFYSLSLLKILVSTILVNQDELIIL